MVQCSCFRCDAVAASLALCLLDFMRFSGKVSVGSNSNILESSVVTALEPAAVSIGSNVVIEQVASHLKVAFSLLCHHCVGCDTEGLHY